jgi:hypothetical protein
MTRVSSDDVSTHGILNNTDCIAASDRRSILTQCVDFSEVAVLVISVCGKREIHPNKSQNSVNIEIHNFNLTGLVGKYIVFLWVLRVRGQNR